MQNYNMMANFSGETVFFCDGTQKIAKQINTIVPYGKVVAIWLNNEYFDFGIDLNKALSSQGIKVYNVIVKDNYYSSIQSFSSLDIKVEDCRAIICCNKKLFCFAMSNYLNLEFTFFIERGENTNGLFVQNFFVKDGDELCLLKRKQGYIIIDTCLLEQEQIIKGLSTKTLMLVDYLFRKELLSQPIEINFYNKAFSLLKSALKLVCDKGEEKLLTLTELSLSLDKLLCEKNCFYQSACTVLSFLETGDFFADHFEFAKGIAKLYKKSLIKYFSKSMVDYRQDVSSLCFITGLNQAYLLKGTLENLNLINNRQKRLYVLQKRQLLAVFDKFCATINTRQGKNTFCQTDFDFLSTLAGLTPLGINGITAIFS